MKITSETIKEKYTHRLIHTILWTYESRTSSYEMITTKDTIETFLNNQKINYENTYIYLGDVNRHFKLFKLETSDLNIKIVDLLFSNNKTFKNKDLFLSEQKFTDYSIHIFNYDHINSITDNDNPSIWIKLKEKFKIKNVDRNKHWTQIKI